MASWLTSQLRVAGDLLEAVDRTAKTVSTLRENSTDGTGTSVTPPRKPVSAGLQESAVSTSKDNAKGEVAVSKKPAAQATLQAVAGPSSPAPQTTPVAAQGARVSRTFDRGRKVEAIPASSESSSKTAVPSISSGTEQLSSAGKDLASNSSSSPATLSTQRRTAGQGAVEADSTSVQGKPALSLENGVPEGNAMQSGALESDVFDDGETFSKREERMVYMVDRLRERLELAQKENEQLEELLRQTDTTATGRAGEIQRLERELTQSEAARISAEAALSRTTQTLEARVRDTSTAHLAAQEQLEVLKARVSELENANESLLHVHQESEGRMLAALREEVAVAEARMEEERAAHLAAQRRATRRELELEESLAEAGNSLSEMQRNVAASAAVIERLQAEVQALKWAQEEMQDAQETASSAEPAREQAAAAGAAEAGREAAGLQEAREALHAARSQASFWEAEAAKLQAEAAELRHLSRDAAELQDLRLRFKEVTDLLYVKQVQLEKLAAQKSAQQMTYEREVASLRSQLEGSSRPARQLYSADEDLIPMDAIGEAYARLANNVRVGGAVKASARFLDGSTKQMLHVLKKYPLWRLVLFGYIFFIHFFVYFLIMRLQHRVLGAEDVISKNHAAGLSAHH